MGIWEFKWHVLVPERPSKGQVHKSKRLSCQSLQNDVLHYLVSGEWQEPMQVTFHIRSDLFLLDSEGSVPFLGPMSATWMCLLLQVWSVNNTDLSGKLGLHPWPTESDFAFCKIPGNLQACPCLGNFGTWYDYVSVLYEQLCWTQVSVRGQEEKNQTNKQSNSGVKNEKEAFYNWGGEKES